MTSSDDPAPFDLTTRAGRAEAARVVGEALVAAGQPQLARLIAASGLAPDGLLKTFGPLRRGRPKGSTAADQRADVLCQIAERRFPHLSPAAVAPRIARLLAEYRQAHRNPTGRPQDPSAPGKCGADDLCHVFFRLLGNREIPDPKTIARFLRQAR